mmetsp:Transcript_24670/g.36350  ORF Transcript_24670/g.36350 Transcript_24670/m.36350 type:complete len:290 (+) Transcript_24670:72-941(+)
MAEYVHKSDLQLVRDYVTAMDHLQYTQLPEDVVCILLTHSNLPAQHPDIRLNLHTTIRDVKDKFRTHIGTSVDHQRLVLKRDGAVIGEMSDDSKMLGFYGVESGMEIHVIDTDPFSLSRGGGLTDTTLVEKYRMSDETYDKRKGTLREFIKEQKAKDANFKLNAKPGGGAPAAAPPTNVGPESVQGITVGNRCQVMPGKRRGSVQFIGEVEQLSEGYWVGVKFDEPCGLTNGTVKGVRYFDCEENYGSFVRGKNVTVGDFPERDLLDSDSEDDEGNNVDPAGDEEEDEI